MLLRAIIYCGSDKCLLLNKKCTFKDQNTHLSFSLNYLNAVSLESADEHSYLIWTLKT